MLAQLFVMLGLLAILYVALNPSLTKFWRWQALRNIPGPENPSWLAGHVPHFWDPLALPFHKHLFDTYGRVMKIYGLFGDPQLYISDPKALAAVLVHDFDIWHGLDVSGELYMNEYLFGPGVNSKNAGEHRKQRKMLNPVFSPSHIRRSMPIVLSKIKELKSVLVRDVGKGETELDIADYFGRLSLESIAQVCLGYSFNAIQSDKHEYVQALKAIIPAIAKVGPAIPILSRLGIGKLPGHVLYRLGRLCPSQDLHHMMDVVEVMHETARRIFYEKKSLVEQEDATIKESIDEKEDFMSTLLKANVRAAASDKLTDDEVLAQMNTLVLAGTDSSSLVICRILELLAHHPHVQERLRAELLENPVDEIDYSKLTQLPYLDAIVKETLRLYAPGPFRPRRAVKDTLLPLQQPIRGVNGTYIHEIFIPKGMEIVVNIYGYNTDPAVWGEDALEWKPDRWLGPMPENVTESNIPGSFANNLAFLAGNRVCIAVKFAELMLKLELATLLPAFRFAPTKHDIVWRYSAMISPNFRDSVSMPRSNLPILISPII